MDLVANSAAVPASKWRFPNELLHRIIEASTAPVATETGDDVVDKSDMIECFLEGYSTFDDVRRHTYKILAALCTKRTSGGGGGGAAGLAEEHEFATNV